MVVSQTAFECSQVSDLVQIQPERWKFDPFFNKTSDINNHIKKKQKLQSIWADKKISG